MRSVTLLLFAIILSATCTFGQNESICYDYDFAGNRISRTICISEGSVFKSGSDSTVLKEYTDDNLQFKVMSNEITVFPNPTEGKFNISISDLDDQSQVIYRLFTINGTLISEINSSEPVTCFDISLHENGSYILHIIIDGIRTTIKVIKQ